jgi:uncharacterized protein YhfF
MENKNSAINKMWDAYLKSIGETIKSTNKKYEAWHFCMDEKNANALAGLVKKGIKCGTTSLEHSYQLENEALPEIGQHNIILDWAGKPQCIIKTTNVEVLLFNEVTEAFAKIEGEGDGSLDYWKKVHRIAFKKELSKGEKEFSDDMLVVCEVFEVVYQ